MLARLVVLLLLAAAAAAPAAPASARSHASADATGGQLDEIAVGELPPEAQKTLARIHAGGPFPYARDGVRFENFEGRLPPRPRGTYREYTVRTPRSHNRGARRIITGDGEYYYTDDHYQTFRRIRE